MLYIFFFPFLFISLHFDREVIENDFSEGAYAVTPFSSSDRRIGFLACGLLPNGPVSHFTYNAGWKRYDIGTRKNPIFATPIDARTIAVAYNYPDKGVIDDMTAGIGRIDILSEKAPTVWDTDFTIKNTQAAIHRIRSRTIEGHVYLLGSGIVGPGAQEANRYNDSAAEIAVWHRQPGTNYWEKFILSDSLHLVHDIRWVSCGTKSSLRALSASSEGLTLLIWDISTNQTQHVTLTKGFSETSTGYVGASSVAIAENYVAIITPYNGDCIFTYNLTRDTLCSINENSTFTVRHKTVKLYDNACSGSQVGGHDIQIGDFNSDRFEDFAVAFRGDKGHMGVWVLLCDSDICDEVEVMQVATQGASMLAVGEFIYSNKRSIVFSGWGEVGQNYLQILTPKLDVDEQTRTTVRVIMISLGIILGLIGCCTIAYIRKGSKPDSAEPPKVDPNNYQRLADEIDPTVVSNIEEQRKEPVNKPDLQVDFNPGVENRISVPNPANVEPKQRTQVERPFLASDV